MPVDPVTCPRNFAEDEGCALHVSIRIAPGKVEEWLSHFRPVYEACVAEAECTLFEVYRDPDDEGVLSWVEHWTKNPVWLFKHQFTRDYYPEYFRITEPMLLSREMKWYTRLPGYSTVDKA